MADIDLSKVVWDSEPNSNENIDLIKVVWDQDKTQDKKTTSKSPIRGMSKEEFDTLTAKARENNKRSFFEVSKGAIPFYDELLGGVAGLTYAMGSGRFDDRSFKDRLKYGYNKIRNDFNDKQDQFKKENPKSSFALRLGGNLINPANRAIAGASSSAIGSLGGGLPAKMAVGATAGATAGALSGADNAETMEQIPDQAMSGAKWGSVIGGAMPMVEKGVNLAGKGLKRAGGIVNNTVRKTKLGTILDRSDSETNKLLSQLAPEGQNNRELLGNMVKDEAENGLNGIKRQAEDLYKNARGLYNEKGQALTEKTRKIIEELNDETILEGKRYLKSVLDNIDENPNIMQLQRLRSDIGRDVVSGKPFLTPNQIDRAYNAITDDIFSSVNANSIDGKGELAVSALKQADDFIRTQKTGLSPQNILGKLSKNTRESSAVAGEVLRDLKSNTGSSKAIETLFNGSQNPNLLKQEIMSQIREPTQFNQLTPWAKKFIYGDKLKEAENIFNGALSNKLESFLGGIADKLGKAKISNMTTPVIVDEVEGVQSRFKK